MKGNLEGALLYWGPRRICQVRTWKWASVPIGGPRFWGRMRGGPFLRPLREGINFLFREIFYEEFERYVKKRPCKRAALCIGALLWNLEGVRSLELFDTKRKCISRFLFLDPEDIKS